MTLIEIPGLEAALAKSEAMEKDLERSAARISKKIPGASAQEVHGQLRMILQDYWEKVDAFGGPKSKQAKKSLDAKDKREIELETGEESAEVLGRIQANAGALAAALRALRSPSWHLLIRAAQGQAVDDHPARLRELPNWDLIDRYRSNDGEGGWIESLVALQVIAKEAAAAAEAMQSPGRRPFSAAVHGGTPDEWLAATCWEFIEKQGSTDSRVVALAVNAVHVAKAGEEIPRSTLNRLVGKVSKKG